MIRVLQCVPGNMDMGGIETFLMNVYRKVDKNKVQFDFLVHKKEKNFWEDEIIKLGGNIYRLPNKSKNFFEYRKQFLALVKNYRIIHIHSVYAFSYFEAKWAKKENVKVILHSHNSNATFKRKIVHLLLKRFQERCIDYRVAPSFQAANWMFSSRSIKEKKVKYINNGFNINDFLFNYQKRMSERKRWNIKNDEFLIGCVGRIDKQKDPLYTFEVFQKVLKLHNNVKLMYVGKGSLKEELEKEIKKRNCKDKVVFTGNVANANELLSAFDLFILPTRYEGLGISIVEAQINGLRTLVSDNVPEEAIVKKDLVQLLSKLDLNSWVSEVDHEIVNYERIGKRRQNIDEFASYDIKNVTRQIEKVYDMIRKV